MCSPSWETHIASDMCFPTWETRIASDLRSLPKIQGLFKTVQTLEVSLYVKVVNEYTSLICA